MVLGSPCLVAGAARLSMHAKKMGRVAIFAVLWAFSKYQYTDYGDGDNYRDSHPYNR